MSSTYPSPSLPLALRYTGRALAGFSLLFVGAFFLLAMLKGLTGDTLWAWVPLVFAVVLAIAPVRLWINTGATRTVKAAQPDVYGQENYDPAVYNGEVIEAVQIDASEVAAINAAAQERAEQARRSAEEAARMRVNAARARASSSARDSVLSVVAIPAASLGALVTLISLLF